MGGIRSDTCIRQIHKREMDAPDGMDVASDMSFVHMCSAVANHAAFVRPFSDFLKSMDIIETLLAWLRKHFASSVPHREVEGAKRISHTQRYRLP